MKKIFIRTLIPMFLLAVATPTVYGQRMTDEQVAQYVRSSMEAGKSQSQISRELMAKGATQAQLQRLKNQASSANLGANSSNNRNNSNQTFNSTRSSNANDTRNPNGNQYPDYIGQDYRANRQRNLPDSLQYNPNFDYQLGNVPMDSLQIEIYGHSLFTNPNLTFEPNENLATPQNYRLGPGDEVVIDIWGVNEDHIRETISPEGTVMISQVGPLYLSGMTIADANKYVRDAFSNIYSGINGENPDSDVNVRLGNVRTIQVNIMGEVEVPGTYRLSPFSSVFHALYTAGGINQIGSLRNVEVIRDGKVLPDIDIYEYLFSGKQTGNIRLQEGDVIRVAPYDILVRIDGNVKRPMYYEMKPNESLAELIRFAGGFTGDAYKEQVGLSRQSNRENEYYNVKDVEYQSYPLVDGDIITVSPILDRYTNRVELRGSAMRPGMYAISDELKTVKDLINKAEGLKEDAYASRVLLYREGPDMTLQVIPINVNYLLSGLEADIELKKNDIIVIASVNELYDRGPVSIHGLVAHPGEYEFADNMSVEDLIIQAGGLLQGASKVKIDVSRRIDDTTALESGDTMAEIFTVELQDGAIINKDKELILKPYDIVEIRKSPNYQTQRRVEVGGEVQFEGTYTLSSKSERISDLVRRAGGVNPYAYLKGATLVRQMTEDELAARDQLLQLLTQNKEGDDSISTAKVINSNKYNVGIELEKILENPGSDIDLVLREGDVLFIPEYNNTVKISGDVMFPNTVAYQKGKKLDFYVNQAGGYGAKAKKSKAFIIYMNGNVSQLKKNTPIEPGSHIIIPSKHNSPVDWQAIISVASVAGTLGTMAAAIATLTK